MKRNRIESPTRLEERLVAEAKALRAEADELPPGFRRDGLLRKARQDETAAYMLTWINSPGLKAPV